MAIALQGTPSVYESSGSTSVVVPYPSGIVANELLLLHVANSGTVMSSTPPSDWSLARVHQTSNASPSEVVFYKIATGSESGSVTFDTTGASGRVTGIMERWSGVDTTTPFDIAAISADSPVATTFTMTLGTTVTDGAMIVHTIGLNAASAADIVTLAGTTKAAGSTGTGRRMGVFYETQATAGASGTRTWTETPTTTSLQWTGIVVVLRPAAGGGLDLSATAAFTGSGTLTKSVAPAFSINKFFAGTGSLAASATPAIARTAAFSGSGTLTASAVKATSVAAPLSGVGTLTATASMATAVSVDLSGSGTLSSTVSPALFADVNLSGLGSLGATATQETIIDASFSGSGTLTAETTQGVYVNVHRVEVDVPPSAEANFGATGTLSASVKHGYRVNVSLWASGVLSAVAHSARSVGASFTADGELSATAVNHTPATYAGSLSPNRFEASLGDVRWKGDLP